MKNLFKTYLIVWAIALAVFNAVAFISASLISPDGFTASFWIGYAFITVAFVGQLACANMAFKADSAKKMFLNVPLVSISYTGFIVMLVAGLICMLVPVIPYWVGIIIAVLVLGFTAISVFQAKAAADIVTEVDEKVKTKTFFIKSLTVDANTVMAGAKSEAVKAECNRVYEAVRYSDPMSSDALSGAETQITLKFNEFSEAVKADNAEAVKAVADELIVLINDRNKKCKILK